jgi:diaminopimelate decarboxylase
LLTKVEYIKEAGSKNFAIIDAGMNDLLRPSLYEAWHDVVEINPKDASSNLYDLAGPVCETGDILATERNLSILPGDYVAFMDAGAYGSVMTSNYNSRLKPIELLVTKDTVQVIKRKESFEDIISLET